MSPETPLSGTDGAPTRMFGRWRHRWRLPATPLVLFAISRLGILLVAYVSVTLITDATNPPPYHLRGTDNVLLDVFGSRWDTGFYVSIAEEGYKLEGVELPSVAFFPLLPMLMRALAPIAGDTVVAGVLISNISLLVAALLFYALVREELAEEVAGRSTWYLLVFPAAVFGSAIYTESLFLMLAIGALYSARRSRWVVAGLLGIAAALCRLHGVLTAILLAGEWWRQRTAGERPPLSALLAAAVTPLGTASYMLFCWRTFGDPLAFATAASAWGRVPRSPFATIADAVQAPAQGWWSALVGGSFHLDNFIDLLAVLLFLVLGCALIAARRWGEGLFVLAGVSLSFGSGLLMSQRRYMWVLFPAFLLLGRWGEKPWIDRTVTFLSIAGLTLFTALFANGYWVA